jgi:hypothetical protein
MTEVASLSNGICIRKNSVNGFGSKLRRNGLENKEIYGLINHKRK